jgi:hypothetical protein
MRFSTASTTPSFTFTPMAVEPSCGHNGGAHGLPISNRTRWHHAALQAFTSRAHLDGLDSILDLEQATLWAECIDAAVILTSCQKHADQARSVPPRPVL